MIDAGDDEASVGLLFVALTRVRHPTHIAFNPWPGIERVTSVIARKQALKNRKVHEVNLRALALQTAQRYGHPTVAPTSKQAAASRKSPVTASLLQPRLRQTRSSPSKRKSPDKPQQQPPVQQPQRRSPRKHASPQKPPISPAAHQLPPHLPKAIALIPSIFRRRNQVGDFLWEINASLRLSQSSGSSKTLWIFNDNQEDRRSSVAGGGNAAIRPYNVYGVHKAAPLSAGITTGSNGAGYPQLSAVTQKVIDEDLAAIATLLKSGAYDIVKFSSDGSGGLGCGIFAQTLGSDVKQYILDGLRRVVTSSQGQSSSSQGQSSSSQGQSSSSQGQSRSSQGSSRGHKRARPTGGEQTERARLQRQREYDKNGAAVAELNLPRLVTHARSPLQPAPLLPWQLEFAQADGLEVKARVVDFWSGSQGTRTAIASWLRDLGFDVTVTADRAQIGQACGYVAARATGLMYAAGNAWRSIDVSDAVDAVWIQRGNASLGNGQTSDVFLETQEVHMLASHFHDD